MLAARPRSGRAESWRVRARDVSLRVGCSAPNRIADRAGRYRRVAVALALLPAPLMVMGLALLGDGVSPPGFVAAHLVMALSCGWLAADLVWRASIVDRRGLPLASAVAMVVGLALLASSRPDGSPVGFGPATAIAPAVIAVVLALAMLVLAERLGDGLLSMVGRSLLVGGAALLGLVELVQAMAAYPGSPTWALGLGAAAWLLVLTACFEARVLVRGLALFRLASRR